MIDLYFDAILDIQALPSSFVAELTVRIVVNASMKLSSATSIVSLKALPGAIRALFTILMSYCLYGVSQSDVYGRVT